MAANALRFTTQPAGFTSEETLSTQPVVEAYDTATGLVDTTFTGVVTLTPDAASTRFYTTSELIATTHTVQAGSTASAILVSPALSFPATLPADYDGRNYFMFNKTVLGSAWSAATAYSPGTFVTTFDGVYLRSYRCILANTNQTPPNATYWAPDAVRYERRIVSGNTGSGQLDLATPYSNAPSAGVTIEVHSGVVPPAMALACVNGVATFAGLSLFGWEPTALVASSPGLTSATSNVMNPTGSRDGPAELPRVTVDTSVPTITGVTVTVGPSGADYTDLQTAIDARVTADSNLNDAIVLQAGATFSNNYLLKKKATGTGWIVIKGHIDPCAEGTRCQPSDFSGNNIAKVVTPVGGAPAFYCDAGAHHFRLQGFEVTHTSLSNGLVNFTDRTAEAADINNGLLANMTHHLIVDRMYIHDDGTHDCKFAVKLNAGTAGIVDSYLTAIDRNNDCQGIADFAGIGPYRIHNNFCQAPSENIIFGGADPYVTGAVTSDVTITNNYLYKPLAWQSDPNINGKVKNLFELKSVRRVLVEGNVLENNWAAGQSGSGFLLSPVNQQSTAVNAGLRDVTVRKNVMRNSSSGFSLNQDGSELGVPSVGLWRAALHDNAIWNINDPLEVQADQRLVAMFNGVCDVRFAHNTLVGSVNATTTKALVFDQPTIPALRSKYDDNLTTAESYSVLAAGEVSPVSITHCLLNGGGSFSHNALVHYSEATAGPSAGYPATTMFPADNGAVGFATVGITSTWDTAPIDDVLAALTITSAGTPDLRTAASDGTAVGADMAAVRAAVTGTVEGTPGTGGGTATQLLLSTPPAGAVSGQPLTQQPVIAIADAGGSTVTSDTSTVTASVQTGVGVTITAGSTAVASSGVATFAGLTLSAAATTTGVVLRFSDGSLTTVDSSPFTLTVPEVAIPERTYPSLLVTDTPSVTRAQWRRRLRQWRQLAAGLPEEDS